MRFVYSTRNNVSVLWEEVCIGGYLLTALVSVSALGKAICPRFVCSAAHQLVSARALNSRIIVDAEEFFRRHAENRCLYNGNLTNDVINTWVTAGMLHTKHPNATSNGNVATPTKTTPIRIYYRKNSECSSETLCTTTKESRKTCSTSFCSFPSADAFANYLTLHWLQFCWNELMMMMEKISFGIDQTGRGSFLLLSVISFIFQSSDQHRASEQQERNM